MMFFSQNLIVFFNFRSFMYLFCIFSGENKLTQGVKTAKRSKNEVSEDKGLGLYKQKRGMDLKGIYLGEGLKSHKYSSRI